MVSSLVSGPKKFSVKKIVNVAVVNQRSCFEEHGPWLQNVGFTHLVMASGELAL